MRHLAIFTIISLTAASLAFGGAAPAAKSKKPATPTPATAQAPAEESVDTGEFEVMKVLARNCAGCHQAEDHPGALFLNRARLSEKDTLQLMIGLIRSSQMPPQHKTFAKSADGKKLLKWLEAELASKKAK